MCSLGLNVLYSFDANQWLYTRSPLIYPELYKENTQCFRHYLLFQFDIYVQRHTTSRSSQDMPGQAGNYVVESDLTNAVVLTEKRWRDFATTVPRRIAAVSSTQSFWSDSDSWRCLTVPLGNERLHNLSGRHSRASSSWFFVPSKKYQLFDWPNQQSTLQLYATALI